MANRCTSRTCTSSRNGFHGSSDARDWISIFTHLVQGGLWAYLYKILARRAVTEVR